MPRGGERSGRPGGTYENRSDMQAEPRTARGPQAPQYGGMKQRDAVTATPELPQPGELIPLDAPSQRPNEPVTAGLTRGAGPGPEILNPMPVQDDALYDLRALFAQYPEYTGLARLIGLAEDEV